jgi:FkbM family methyltransferase
MRQLVSYDYRRDTKDNFHLSLLMSFILREDSSCIDIGASRGKILQEMMSLAPNGRHLAFGPIPEMADRLRRLFPKALVESVALSDENGTARCSRILGEEGYSSLSDRQFSGSPRVAHIDVPTACLDDVIPHDFAPLLIKIDVEGAEYLVLSGARETLKKYKPTIWFEHGASSSAYFQYDLSTDLGSAE